MERNKHERSHLILVTGANGFVGTYLCQYLAQHHRSVRKVLRHPVHMPDAVFVKDVGPETDWHDALAGVTHVVHLAARVHVMDEKAKDPSALYDQVNTDGTLRLARMASQAGVKRFVYVSSVKVHGEFTSSSIQPSGPEVFHEGLVPKPMDPYGASKYRAEIGLRQIESESGMEVSILRPPLIYGPGVRANFLKLIQLVDLGIPLPFGRIKNNRSMVFVGNLADAIDATLFHPNAAGQTFLVSDGQGISSAELIRELARQLKISPRLIPIPAEWLFFISRALGRRSAAERLLGSLAVDSSSLQKQLNWTPPFSFEDGIKATIAWYLHRKKGSPNIINLSSEVAP